MEFLNELLPSDSMRSQDIRFNTFLEEISQHTEKNDDWDNAQLLDRLGFMDASDELLYELFELLVHPTVREGSEQREFVRLLNEALGADGIILEENGEISGANLFTISRPGVGVGGRPKNIIFASDGPKPDIVLSDAINNDIRIVKNADHVLVYDRSVTSAGLTLADLLDWWKGHPAADQSNIKKSLYNRLVRSLASPPEKLFFDGYYSSFKDEHGNIPALIPQVYLHYDPKTVRELANNKYFYCQRMDFLLLLPRRVRIVIEIDGRQHYADETGKASTSLYAEMVHADRNLKLQGYEVYRFGGSELPDEATAKAVVKAFFSALLTRHGWEASKQTISIR